MKMVYLWSGWNWRNFEGDIFRCISCIEVFEFRWMFHWNLSQGTWRHNDHDGDSNHQPHDCLLKSFIQTQIKENIKAPCHWPLCGEFTGERWIPRTNGQLRGKCFHLMTSSWYAFQEITAVYHNDFARDCQWALETGRNSHRPQFYQTRSAWSMDQGSTKKRSAVHNFIPTATKFCVMWEGLSRLLLADPYPE